MPVRLAAPGTMEEDESEATAHTISRQAVSAGA